MPPNDRPITNYQLPTMDNFFKQATPDPSWEYAPAWEQLGHCQEELNELLLLLKDQEQASIQATTQAKRRVEVLYCRALDALNALRPTPAAYSGRDK